jgi:hypothetical protein
VEGRRGLCSTIKRGGAEQRRAAARYRRDGDAPAEGSHEPVLPRGAAQWPGAHANRHKGRQGLATSRRAGETEGTWRTGVFLSCARLAAGLVSLRLACTHAAPQVHDCAVCDVFQKASAASVPAGVQDM